MKKVLLFFGLLLFVSLHSFSSSYSITTDTINGCTDTMAVNYDPLANYDNGSCVYDDTVYIDSTSQVSILKQQKNLEHFSLE